MDQAGTDMAVIPFQPRRPLAARSAVIVGGGIGGLACALALRQAGIAVQVLEQARKLREVGAGLQLSPNATRILRDLGVLERIEKAAVAPRALLVRDGRTGTTLSRSNYAPAARRWGAPFLVIHRADLQDALAAAAQEAGAAVALGVDLRSIERTASGVRAVVGQGDQLVAHGADVLIGADGVRSAVRSHLGFAAPPVFARRVAYRATIEMPDGHPPEVHLHLGKNAHVVVYPVRGGKALNLVAIVKEERAVTRWSAPGDAGFVHAAFEGWNPDLRRLMARAGHFLCWGLYDIDPLARWGEGRVTLLGDAAHAMLPFLAQGAAQAIEDAAALAGALTRGTQAEPALRAYEAARRERTAMIQGAARRNGVVYHLSGPPRMARDLVLRRTGGDSLLKRYGWIYGV
jgi:salicylate hydroxylase